MTVRVDPDLIEQLAGELHVVGRAIETTERELTTMVVQLLQEVEREYPEATVRAVVEEVRGLLRTVRTDAQGLATWYAQEARQLRTIVERYRQTEAEAMRLARRNIPVISANRFAVGAAHGGVRLVRGSRPHAGFSKIKPVTNQQDVRAGSAMKPLTLGNSLQLPSGVFPWDSNKRERVQQLQQRLKQLGQSVLVNGTMDEQTKVAVKAYQKKYGIAPAGGVGTMDEQTWLALFGRITKPLKQGDRGDAVRMMQIRLNELGYALPATDFFGSQTLRAVLTFHKDRQMSHQGFVAGVMDVQGWQSLFGTQTSLPLPVEGGAIKLSRAQLIKVGWNGKYVTDKMVADLNRVLEKYQIVTAERVYHFLSQTMHESALGRYPTEQGKKAYFDRYEPSVPRGRKKAKELGNTQKGDGYLFRGGGYIQLTGRWNYTSFAKAIKDPHILKSGAELVAEKYAWEAAGYWWKQNKMNQLVDQLQKEGKCEEQITDQKLKVTGPAAVFAVTRKVNSGSRGIEERIQFYQKVKKELGSTEGAS